MAEVLVFAYVGMTSAYYFLNFWISWQFILAQLIFVVVARTLGIFISYYAFECCKITNTFLRMQIQNRKQSTCSPPTIAIARHWQFSGAQ